MPVEKAALSPLSLPHDSTLAVADDVLDLEVLRGFERVKSEDGSDILIELIDLYLQGASKQILAMYKAAAPKDWEAVKRAAHTLKGTSSTLGLHLIAKTCREIEEALPNSTGQARLLMDLLELRFQEVEPLLVAERNRRRGECVIPLIKFP